MEILDNFNDPSNSFPQDLASLYNRLTTLHRQNSTKWAQRARLLWVNCGDINSGFFHNSVRIHNHYKSIPHISDLNGNVFTNQQDISKNFVNFLLIFGLIL